MALLDNAYETVTLEQADDHILRIVLDRPEAANAMNTQMGFDLREIYQSLYMDQEDWRCIILTGRGERAFCAGGDLKERNGMTDETWQRQHALFEQMVMNQMDVPVPIIAAVNGAAYGGGTEMVLAADFAYGSTNAKFALTEVTLGIMPGAAGTQNLPRAVGVRRAKEIILSGKAFGAAEAENWGILNSVHAPEELNDAVLEICRRIAGNAPISIRQAKKSINVATQVDLKNGYMFEIEAYNRMVPTEDRLEGVRAFNEKRKARFTGK